MRAIRLTKAEAEVIRVAIGLLCSPWGSSGADEKAAAKVLAKLKAAEEPVVPGVNPAPIEQALIAHSQGKVVPLQGGWPMVSRRLTQAGATVGDAALIGGWMARQGWLHGPQTLIDVLNKWPSWLAKAKATQQPDPLKPGLGGTSEAGRSTEGAGGGPPGRLRPGFKG